MNDHVVGEFAEDVLVGHDEFFGRFAVGDVGQYAQRLLFDVGTVLALQYQNDGLHDLATVLRHNQVDVRLGRQQIAQQTQRLHHDADLVIGQQTEDLIGAQR